MAQEIRTIHVKKGKLNITFKFHGEPSELALQNARRVFHDIMATK